MLMKLTPCVNLRKPLNFVQSVSPTKLRPTLTVFTTKSYAQRLRYMPCIENISAKDTC